MKSKHNHRTETCSVNNRPGGCIKKKTALPQKARNRIFRSLDDFLQIHSIGTKNIYGDLIISGSRIA